MLFQNKQTRMKTQIDFLNSHKSMIQDIFKTEKTKIAETFRQLREYLNTYEEKIQEDLSQTLNNQVEQIDKRVEALKVVVKNMDECNLEIDTRVKVLSKWITY